MTTNPSATRGLRVLDLILKVFTVILIVVTALAVPLIVLVLSGNGTVNVKGKLDAPFTVDFQDGRRITVAGDTRSFENFPIGRESESLTGIPTVDATVTIQSDDRDSRAVVVGLELVWLAAAWTGLLSFRALVRSALAGEPFAAANPRRLRRLSGALLVIAGAGLIGQWLLDRTVDTDLPFRVALDTSSWLTMLVVGIAVLALAEPFAEAARLREFEASTI